MGRAGGHPTPYVSIGTSGDFEKVLGCQVNELKTVSQTLGVFSGLCLVSGLDINSVGKKITRKNQLS